MPTLNIQQRFNQNQNQQPSYKERIKERFKQQVKRIVQKYELSQLVLVIDLKTALLISNLFKIPELVEMKISFLQRIQVKRKRMPQLHALYYIPCTSANIELMKGDFPAQSLSSKNQRSGSSKKQYKRIHILFSSFAPHPLLKQIAIYKPLLKRIAQNSIKQFYHSSRLLSDNLTVFDIEYMHNAYSKQQTSNTKYQEQHHKRLAISQKILEFVVNLAGSQINTVRVYYKKSPNCISQQVSQYTQKAVNKYISCLLENKSHSLKKDADDITLLILDRAIDPVTPLLHSFTYEALLFDLLKVTFEGQGGGGSKGESGQQDKQYFLFNEFNDQIYQQYRYQHISKALQELPEQLNKQNQKLTHLQKKGGKQQNEVDITELNEKVSSLRKHIEMLDVLYKQFKLKELNEIGQLEQALATGLSGQGKNTSSSGLLQEVLTIVKGGQKGSRLTKDEKLRLGLLVLCCIKLSKKDYQRLLNHYDQEDQQALKHIIALGISYDKSIKSSTKAISKDQQKVAQARLQRTCMPLDRYTSILQLIIPMVTQILSGKHPQTKRLDPSLFGMLKCDSLAQQGQLQIIKFNQKKFIVVMLGGMAFGQISALKRHEKMQSMIKMYEGGSTQMIIGTDDVLTPSKYLTELKKIDIFSNSNV